MVCAGLERRHRTEGRHVLALLLILAVGFAARALVVLDPPVLPGPDGAYYLVQVRGLLRDGALPIPDMPLLFYALAGLAWLMTSFQETASAIVSAVCWTDAVLPLTIIVPVYAIACQTQPGRVAVSTLLAGLLAVASGNVLVLAGGAIKNGAVLPFALACIHWSALAEQRRSPGALLLATAFLFVSCLIHVSALAIVLAFTVPWIGCRAARNRNWRLPAFAIGLVVAAATVFWFDPERGTRILGTCLRPWRAFSPDWRLALQQPPVWLGNGLGVLGLLMLGARRRELSPWAADLLAASSLAALLLSCPLLRPEFLERLSLVALVPGLVVAVFLAGWRPVGPILLTPLLVLALAHGFLAAKTLRVTGLTQAAYSELQGLREVLPPGPRVVMVRPLLRWWAAWILDTKFSTSAAPVLKHREGGTAILVLDEVRTGAFGLAPSPVGATPGFALRDGAVLQRESFRVLSEGALFRLSRLVPAAEGDLVPGTRDVR
jgi:hypothetical protein